MTPELNSAGPSSILPAAYQPAVNLLVQAILNKNGLPAPIAAVEATISEMQASIAKVWPETTPSLVYEAIAREAMKQIAVDISAPVVLAPDFTPWFDDAVVNGSITLERWYSYKQLLQSRGFAPLIVDSLDRASSEVIDLLGAPTQSGAWKRRGLVIGDVQSGKTATYIGIVNKAADAGFRLVVLLTGGTESLRKQTQYRIDEGFLGKDSKVDRDKVIGVGHFPTHTQFLRGQGMTTYAKDFVGASLAGQAVHIDPNADHPYVFVIKKNKVPLTNLISWLSGQFDGEQFDIPMLVVDDESDYASVNTNYRVTGDTSPTIINRKIRELLALTTRSSYLAFTATPFANVFIDHNTFDEALKDDLFPHHYIFALSSPSNYVGAKSFFGTSASTISLGLVDVSDAHEVFPAKHKSHLAVDYLPDSLEDALRAFVVASAIRLARGDHGPRSMLVNVSRFKNVQRQVYELVTHEFARIKTAIEIHAQPPTKGIDTHEVLLELAESYATYFANSGCTWPAVRDKLFAALYDTTIELVNSSRDKSSDEAPRNMIAVGGDVLSRGLTLEGLTVSYFYRLVGAADTLLQMARWFGYRPGYEDLVRIWISPDIADQFRYVSDISDELREQIREMRDLGKTPEDFGLLVRKHPESLAITAKRGVSEARSMVISLSGRRIETTSIPSTPSLLISNYEAVRHFLQVIENDDPAGGWDQPGLKFRGKVSVSRERIADLIEAFRYDRRNLIFTNALHKIIRGQTTAAFQDWTVGIVGGSRDSLQLTPGLLTSGTPMRAVRYSPDGSTGTFHVSGSSARLAGKTDLASTYAHAGPDLVETGESDTSVYKELPNPTLLIYPLTPNFEVKSNGESVHAENLAASETAAAKAAWARATSEGLTHLMALKVAIPGDPGAGIGDVVYLLNGPAIEEFSNDFDVSEGDEEDLDD